MAHDVDGSPPRSRGNFGHGWQQQMATLVCRCGRRLAVLGGMDVFDEASETQRPWLLTIRPFGKPGKHWWLGSHPSISLSSNRSPDQIEQMLAAMMMPIRSEPISVATENKQFMFWCPKCQESHVRHSDRLCDRFAEAIRSHAGRLVVGVTA